MFTRAETLCTAKSSSLFLAAAVEREIHLGHLPGDVIGLRADQRTLTLEVSLHQVEVVVRKR